MYYTVADNIAIPIYCCIPKRHEVKLGTMESDFQAALGYAASNTNTHTICMRTNTHARTHITHTHVYTTTHTAAFYMTYPALLVVFSNTVNRSFSLQNNT